VLRLLHAYAHSRHVSVVCGLADAGSDDYRYLDYMVFLHDGEAVYAGPTGDAPLRALAAHGVTRPLAGSVVQHLGPCRPLPPIQPHQLRCLPYNRAS
jgi:hypothetical protein